MNKIVYQELITFHPGYYVKDLIEDLAMTQDELAKRLQTTSKTVSDLVNGKINLTDEMAMKLSIVFGTSVNMWLNLNKTYIEKKIEIDRRVFDDEQIALIKNIDYKFWVNLGLVDPVTRAIDKVKELQRYFQVSNLAVLQRRDFLVQFRTAIDEVNDTNIVSANAWVQTAINMGRDIDVDPFDIKKLKAAIPVIRKMTTQSASEFYPTLKNLLASCGVVLVLLPNLKNCGVNGAVKWMSKEKVILAINDRRKYADTFWFSLFHELGHVLQKRLTMLIVSKQNEDLLEEDKLLQKLEEEADDFAQNILIPKDEYNDFINQSIFTEYSIKKFANKINIHPGIIIGRLQKDNLLRYNTNLNSLKQKYIIISE